ncbi:MurR/RpiR family transcriptional regulator [Sedimentitalea nanhaiensis]|uniref:Transcriptional regulator, RpiR family n=1 Tax=Sedimentitalea nanhaiensis TaxID=999627 RepID=A0A1I7CS58_9RHOB|nr:MurR/RpiR family transcriptional regulator [Sedimentitalea nanhaiensis]SFU02236.1 transcriptional regulator, RpiR family [Sedimentitalea nanhaiensis]
MDQNLPVKARLEAMSDTLTATERKLCTALLLDYPFAGLDPIQILAKKTKTSPPSISRFVSKLGFSGYHDFQRQLIDELKDGNRSPLDLHQNNRALKGAFLEDFVTRATTLLADSTSAITQVQFERVCALFADEKRNIYVIGGRISDAIALYLSRHLRQIRGNVFHLPADPEIWPEYLLRMKPRDVLFIVDFRRYQPSLEKLAERATTRQGAQVVVLTDKWLSPVARTASEVIATPIESGTVWDSYAGALVLLEAVVTRIAEGNWDKARKRIERWDALRLDLGEMTDDQ